MHNLLLPHLADDLCFELKLIFQRYFSFCLLIDQKQVFFLLLSEDGFEFFRGFQNDLFSVKLLWN